MVGSTSGGNYRTIYTAANEPYDAGFSAFSGVRYLDNATILVGDRIIRASDGHMTHSADLMPW